MDTSVITNLLKQFPAISLDKMGKVQLMNRIDTKYTTNPKQLQALLQLMSDNYYVQEINENRISAYQTVYLDTESLKMYTDHQNGKKTREKIRIRKYIDTNQIFLEIKDKNNKGRTKKTRISISGMEQLRSEAAENFIQEKSKFHSKEIFPCLENRFYRITFVNKEMTERLTIDLSISFHNLNTDVVRQIDDLVIIELKQDGNAISPAKKMLAELHIRPVSISKYCLGSILTNPTLKHNRFKSKLIQINKLTHSNYGRIS